MRPIRLLSQVPRLGARFLRHGAPARTLLFGPLSLGDDLLCTTVLREARLRRQPFAMMTNRSELFEGNEDPSAILPVDDYYARALVRLGRRVIQPYYSTVDPTEPDRDIFAPGHGAAEMCRVAGLKGEVALRPYLNLNPQEAAAGRRAERQIAMQSTAAGAALAYGNKEWFPARFAEAARRLPPGFKAVQLGMASDPPLPGAIDLRGRTTLREAAAVLAASAAFVGLEGFLGHLARAVDCPAVVVLGGRVLPETFGYPCNEYLAAPTPCTPCGLRDTCHYGRACLDGVTIDAVLAALGRVLARPPGPLAVQKAILT